MISTLLLLCALHSCSNDTLGVLGDEALTWDPAPNASIYHVGRVLPDGGVQACLSTTETSAPITPGGACDPPGRGPHFVVQMCTPDGECGAWSDPVEILPFACWTADVPTNFTIINVEERPCLEDSPDRPQADEPWNPIPLPVNP